MSDIVRARLILRDALEGEFGLDDTRKAIRQALRLMVRKSPAFRVLHDCPAMTAATKAQARRLRQRGWSVRRIAIELGTNSGRVSEAINGH